MIHSIKIPGKGYTLSATLILPQKSTEKLPGVVFYHGMVSKSKPRYVERGQQLAEKGIASFCFDFRGCGESDGKLGDLSLSDWLNDALLAFDFFIKKQCINKNRIGIAGKSFGGYMSALVCTQRAVKSMVLQAPGLYDDAWFGKKFSWNDEFMQQRQEYRKSSQVFNNRAVYAIQEFKNPLLIIASEFDVICPRSAVEGLYDRAGSATKEFHIIKGADHALRDEKYNAEYTNLMINWFQKTL